MVARSYRDAQSGGTEIVMDTGDPSSRPDHEANLAFFAAHAEQQQKERLARQRARQEQWLTDFGHFDMADVDHDDPGLCSCVRCRRVREPKTISVINSYGCLVIVIYLKKCDCCQSCGGKGFFWTNTPMPPDADIYGPSPPGWKPYTQQKCKCMKSKKGKS